MESLLTLSRWHRIVGDKKLALKSEILNLTLCRLYFEVASSTGRFEKIKSFEVISVNFLKCANLCISIKTYPYVIKYTLSLLQQLFIFKQSTDWIELNGLIYYNPFPTTYSYVPKSFYLPLHVIVNKRNSIQLTKPVNSRTHVSSDCATGLLPLFQTHKQKESW